jgi:hypothetical protein
VAFLLDPAELGALASRVEGCADELRSRAGRLVAATAARWQSTAADAFRRLAADLAADLRRAAGGLDVAARAWRQHAHRAGLVRSAVAAPVEAVVDAAVSWSGG